MRVNLHDCKAHCLVSTFALSSWCFSPPPLHTRLDLFSVVVVFVELLHFGVSHTPLLCFLVFLILLTLPYFGMLTYNFKPPMTILSNCHSKLCTSFTPLNRAKPYILPFLFLCLEMKISFTSPHFLNWYHRSFSVASSGNCVK